MWLAPRHALLVWCPPHGHVDKRTAALPPPVLNAVDDYINDAVDAAEGDMEAVRGAVPACVQFAMLRLQASHHRRPVVLCRAGALWRDGKRRPSHQLVLWLRRGPAHETWRPWPHHALPNLHKYGDGGLVTLRRMSPRGLVACSPLPAPMAVTVLRQAGGIVTQEV